MGEFINIIAIVLVGLTFLLTLYFIFKKDPEHVEENVEINIFSIPYLKEAVKNEFNRITSQNIAELYLNKRETIKREEQKARLSKALRSCAHGNVGEKSYVKDYIKDVLQSKFGINEETINLVINFDNPNVLSCQDKFEILLYTKKKTYRDNAFIELSKIGGFEEVKHIDGNTKYKVTKEDIHRLYDKIAEPLEYVDKLEIVTQRIYQELYGFSVADELRDMNIDGISGGVSGISTEQYYYMDEDMENGGARKAMSYDSLWVFLHGKPIHLECLSFGTQEELIRVCKNLYMYDNVGHLTSSKGYKLTYLADSSRVVVVRPNFTSHWAFFVRKFGSANKMSIKDLVNDKGNQYVMDIIKWATKGCLNLLLSGDQNSGKTTFLRAMIGLIDQRYPIRTTEQDFELWIANTFPEWNTSAFRNTDEVSLMEAIGIEKKTDAVFMILGEINSPDLAEAYVSLMQAGTKMTWGTIHTVTTEDTVEYLRNACLSKNFTNELIAEEQVANKLNLDIHWVKTPSGKRYISRITEIEPYSRSQDDWPEDKDERLFEFFRRMTRRRAFTTRELVVYENGRYVQKNIFSDRLINKIMSSLDDEQTAEFKEYIEKSQKEISANE